MLASELRRKYIEFFISKGSKQIPSSSLVPNDTTLLFTNAGMVQFKPYFLGLETPPAPRAAGGVEPTYAFIRRHQVQHPRIGVVGLAS